MHPLHRQHTAIEDGDLLWCLSALIGQGVVRDRDTAQLVCRTLHENFTVACKGEKIVMLNLKYLRMCIIHPDAHT